MSRAIHDPRRAQLLYSYMVQAYYEPISSGLCFQMHLLPVDHGKCDPTAKASDIWGEGCGVCKEEYPGVYGMATGCDTSNSTGTITFHRSCSDSACSNCANTLQVPMNSCYQQGKEAILATGPFHCEHEIVYREFKGTNCSGTPAFHNRMYDSKMCFNFNGHAQMYDCS